MQHLELERIASFDHEPPSVDELSHLAACRFCRTERSAMHELNELATHAVSYAPEASAARLTNWEQLAVQLRAEGLITSAPVSVESSAAHAVGNSDLASKVLPFAPVANGLKASSGITDSWAVRATPRNRTEWWRAAAAALLLVLGGGALGRISAGAAALPGAPVAAGVSRAGFDVSLGSTGFSSVNEARTVLENAQRNYEHASLWLAANDTESQSSDLVRRRLAALDQMVAASHSGLADSPNDPVLNHYYFAARAMREATLQQLGGALPVGRSIERF